MIARHQNKKNYSLPWKFPWNWWEIWQITLIYTSVNVAVALPVGMEYWSFFPNSNHCLYLSFAWIKFDSRTLAMHSHAKVCLFFFEEKIFLQKCRFLKEL